MGSKSSRQYLSNKAGTGSKERDLEEIFFTRSNISSSDVAENSVNSQSDNSENSISLEVHALSSQFCRRRNQQITNISMRVSILFYLINQFIFIGTFIVICFPLYAVISLLLFIVEGPLCCLS